MSKAKKIAVIALMLGSALGTSFTMAGGGNCAALQYECENGPDRLAACQDYDWFCT